MRSKKKSASLPKLPKKKPLQRKKKCSICSTDESMSLVVQNSLFRKYSQSHFSYLNIINNEMEKKQCVRSQETKSYLKGYMR